MPYPHVPLGTPFPPAMAHISGPPALPPSYSPAERLYTRLVYRDEAAWNAMNILIRLSKEGNPKALRAWRKIAEVHLRKTPKLEDFARRLLARAKARDGAAWTAIGVLVREAKKGNPRALRAWSVLAKVHVQQGGEVSGRRKGKGHAYGHGHGRGRPSHPRPPGSPQVGYYPFPEHARAGIDFSPTARALHPARIQELLALIQHARVALPAPQLPGAAFEPPVGMPGGELIPPVGMPPAAPPPSAAMQLAALRQRGKLAEALRLQQVLKARATLARAAASRRQ